MARLAAQRLGLVVGLVTGVLLTLGVFAVLLLVGNRDSTRNAPARPAARGRVFYTLRTGDVALARLAATRCEASAEAGIPNLFCERMPSGRYQVVF